MPHATEPDIEEASEGDMAAWTLSPRPIQYRNRSNFRSARPFHPQRRCHWPKKESPAPELARPASQRWFVQRLGSVTGPPLATSQAAGESFEQRLRVGSCTNSPGLDLLAQPAPRCPSGAALPRHAREGGPPRRARHGLFGTALRRRRSRSAPRSSQVRRDGRVMRFSRIRFQ